MAALAGVGDDAASFVTNSVTEKVVYDDKEEQANTILGQAGAQETSSGVGSPAKQKDFYWDQIELVLISAILSFSFLDISIKFFRGSETSPSPRLTTSTAPATAVSPTHSTIWSSS